MRDGYTLVELLVILAVAALLFGLSIPPLINMSRRVRLELAANELMTALRVARITAIRLNSKVALKFFINSAGGVTYTMFRDGDGDGVLTRDIESGVDPPVSLPRTLGHFGTGVSFGFPPGPAPRDPGDPGRRLRNLDDPIRLNRSDMASFSPLGSSTPGSLYFTDNLHWLAVVRIFATTGKVKVLLYDPEREVWE